MQLVFNINVVKAFTPSIGINNPIGSFPQNRCNFNYWISNLGKITIVYNLEIFAM